MKAPRHAAGRWLLKTGFRLIGETRDPSGQSALVSGRRNAFVRSVGIVSIGAAVAGCSDLELKEVSSGSVDNTNTYTRLFTSEDPETGRSYPSELAPVYMQTSSAIQGESTLKVDINFRQSALVDDVEFDLKSSGDAYIPATPLIEKGELDPQGKVVKTASRSLACDDIRNSSDSYQNGVLFAPEIITVEGSFVRGGKKITFEGKTSVNPFDGCRSVPLREGLTF